MERLTPEEEERQMRESATSATVTEYPADNATTEIEKLRAELRAWENYWGPDAREKASAEIALLRAQVGVLSDVLKGVIRVADRQTFEFDAARKALSNPAITERLEAERELRERIKDLKAYGAQPGSLLLRDIQHLIAAASRMWPSGKGEK